jgi:hypothetical protein
MLPLPTGRCKPTPKAVSTARDTCSKPVALHKSKCNPGSLSCSCNGMVDQDTVHGYVKQAGHCTRCGDPFGGNRTTAFMVRERIIWRDNPWDGPSIFWQWETVPASEACVTPKEQDETTRSIICKGCSLSMLLPEHRRRRRTGGWLTGRVIEQTCCSRQCGSTPSSARTHVGRRRTAEPRKPSPALYAGAGVRLSWPKAFGSSAPIFVFAGAAPALHLNHG